MQHTTADIPISVCSVDRDKHTISLTVDGCPVTAVCAPENNKEMYRDIKELLIDSLVRSAKFDTRKLDKT